MALIGSASSAKDLRKNTTVFSGRFFPAGAGAVTGGTGPSYSVARTGTGTFTITLLNTRLSPPPTVGFSHRLGALVKAIPGVQHTTAVDLKAQFGDYTAATAAADATIILRLVAVATATDMAANANSSVSFELVFSDSVVA